MSEDGGFDEVDEFFFAAASCSFALVSDATTRPHGLAVAGSSDTGFLVFWLIQHILSRRPKSTSHIVNGYAACCVSWLSNLARAQR